MGKGCGGEGRQIAEKNEETEKTPEEEVDQSLKSEQGGEVWKG